MSWKVEELPGFWTVIDANGKTVCICTIKANAEMIVEMRNALERGKCPCWVHNAGITNDIDALRRIALWHADWNNNVRLPIIEPKMRAVARPMGIH